MNGTRLGPYEILAPLGAGGMGEVYRARDERLGRVVAIKVLSKEFVADAGRLRRFEQEAKTSSAKMAWSSPRLRIGQIAAWVHGVSDRTRCIRTAWRRPREPHARSDRTWDCHGNSGLHVSRASARDRSRRALGPFCIRSHSLRNAHRRAAFKRETSVQTMNAILTTIPGGYRALAQSSPGSGSRGPMNPNGSELFYLNLDGGAMMPRLSNGRRVRCAWAIRSNCSPTCGNSSGRSHLAAL